MTTRYITILAGLNVVMTISLSIYINHDVAVTQLITPCHEKC